MPNERLRRAMRRAEARGISAEAIAEVADVPIETLDSWIDGTATPDERSRVLVATILQADANFLWPPPGPRRRGATREDWIAAASRVFSQGRAPADKDLTIDALGDSQGLTRGSFYNHFSGVEDLYQALIKEWTDSWDDLATRIGAIRDPEDRLAQIAARATQAPQRDRAMRGWAETHPAAAGKAVANVDKVIAGHVAQAVADIGLTAADTAVVTNTIVACLSTCSPLLRLPADVAMRDFRRLVSILRHGARSGSAGSGEVAADMGTTAEGVERVIVLAQALPPGQREQFTKVAEAFINAQLQQARDVPASSDAGQSSPMRQRQA